MAPQGPGVRLHRGRLLPVGALAAIVSLLWISATGRRSWSDWTVPGAVRGDIVEVAARIEVANQNRSAPWNLFGHVEHLGAPFGADWSTYPVSDRPEFWLAGMLAAPLGVFTVLNLFTLLGFIAGAASFFLCARALRWSPAWALAGAVLFAFAPYNYVWSANLSLGLTYTLPPAILLFQWIARRAPVVRLRRWRWLAIGVGLAMGMGDPYCAFMAGQLGILACLLQLRRGAQWPRLRVGAWFLGALIFGLLPTVGPGLAARLSGAGERVALVRNYGGAERYALKPVELFLPPFYHRLGALSRVGAVYAHSTILPGELGHSWLGVVGGLSFVALLAVAAMRLTDPHRRRIPDAALASGWVLAYSVVGGVNGLLALGGLDLFRATGRYSIFLFTWALFFGFGRLQRLLPRREAVHWAAALVLTVIGFLDQVPAAPSSSLFRQAAATLAADRDAAARLASAASPHANVFELPAVPFPEAPARYAFTDYQHFRLYLANPSLRYSYGSLRGSVACDWGQWVARQPPAVMVAELQKAGFDLLTIDRRAFPYRAPHLIRAFESLGLRAVPLPETPDLAAFRLVPVNPPVLPAAGDPRFLDQWDGEVVGAAAGPALFVKGSWYRTERNAEHVWRWARRRADLVIWREPTEPATAYLNAELRSLSPGALTIEFNGASFWAGATSMTPGHIHDRPLVLRPGANYLSFVFYGALRRPSEDSRYLGMNVTDLVVTYQH